MSFSFGRGIPRWISVLPSSRRYAGHHRGDESDFVAEYDVARLVPLAPFDNIEAAIRRERDPKAWGETGNWT